jgi:hypothetical protein
VANLKDGNFIGEVSFITGGAATATVKALLPTRYVASEGSHQPAFKAQPQHEIRDASLA